MGDKSGSVEGGRRGKVVVRGGREGEGRRR